MAGTADSIVELLDRLARRDSDAAAEIHRRYTPRLVALARTRLDGPIRAKTSPESAVQSALGSFFRRYDDGEFRIGNWDDLWGLLAIITVRKSVNRARYFLREQRNVNREQPLPCESDSADGCQYLAGAAPDPADAAILAETIAIVMKDLNDNDRRIVECLLAGHTVEETRRIIKCSDRTVRRVRERVRDRLRRIDASLGAD